jgi:hypothetical protein
MTSMPLEAALAAVRLRNEALVGAYKDGARSVLSGPVSRLARSMADQRRELGKDLAELALLPGLQEAVAELDLDPLLFEKPLPWNTADVNELLERMRSAEADDYLILACIAGAFVPVSTEAAERVAALAEQARKRSTWARDHLDLLGIASSGSKA